MRAEGRRDVEARPLTNTTEPRREPHRCACGARFELSHYGDPMDQPMGVDVRCPACGRTHALTVPEDSGEIRVELLPGPEPETGVGD